MLSGWREGKHKSDLDELAGHTTCLSSPHVEASLLPTLSVIIVTYNCATNLRECLSRIAEQDYPKDKVELLVVDGGSTDETLQIAGMYGATIIQPGFSDNQEPRRAVGLLSAVGELVVYVDSDNFLPYPHWLREMVQPLIENSAVIAVQTLRYTYRRSDSLLNRYFALFGVNDPVAYYLNKRDRLSWAENGWKMLGRVIDENDSYYVVEFDGEHLPTLGCNGFLIRREILLKANCRPEFFFHTDVLHDLAKQGYNQYGIVKNSVIHATGGSFLNSLKKRFVYMEKHFQNMELHRRYRVYDSRNTTDNIQLAKFVFYTVTLCKPFYDSLKGFLKIRDIAWFIHLPMCWGIFLIYSFATVKSKVERFSTKK